jgi:hypothetical protein
VRIKFGENSFNFALLIPVITDALAVPIPFKFLIFKLYFVSMFKMALTMASALRVSSSDNSNFCELSKRSNHLSVKLINSVVLYSEGYELFCCLHKILSFWQWCAIIMLVPS